MMLMFIGLPEFKIIMCTKFKLFQYASAISENELEIYFVYNICMKPLRFCLRLLSEGRDNGEI